MEESVGQHQVESMRGNLENGRGCSLAVT